MKKIIVTGGAGFIGSAVVRYILNHTQDHVLVLDKLTYAGNLATLAPYFSNDRFEFVQADILDQAQITTILNRFQPDAIMHLAAESHVDRSIDGPKAFIETNIVGTYHLLEAVRAYYQDLTQAQQEHFRFHHISTDEVYGDLHGTTDLFTEATPYAPSSPYSASKASSDHLVRAWHRTFGLPVLITNCSNNYGSFHFPEKLIPLTIINALSQKALPIYGDGKQIRDWLYVDDHAKALYTVVMQGKIGETYNIGGHNEKQNIEVVKTICALLDELKPAAKPYSDLITFVTDRKGHDQRYAIDASKIDQELGWKPAETFASGLRKTVQWYLDNQSWWQAILDGSYRQLKLENGKVENGKIEQGQVK